MAGPHRADDRTWAIRWMGLACSGFQVLVHTTDCCCSARGGSAAGLPDTLLGFETAGPSPLRPDRGEPGVVLHLRGCGVLSLHFGGGVWCLIRG